MEAFSDGVIAIIITIMVLELKPPHGADWASLKTIAPTFVGYVMSFLFIGVYWVNHHHLLHTVKNLSAGIMLANLNLLFWLSLVPFVTGWVGENNFAPFPVSVYAVLLNLCGVAYIILQKTIEVCHRDSEDLKLIMKKQTQKGIVSLACYTAAIPLAWLHPFISVGLFFLVAFIWLIPDKNIEKIMLH